jgi:hypothetical protein
MESSQERAPAALAVPNTTRDWTDANHNFIPDCDLTNPNKNGVIDTCGTLANLNFGQVASNITQYDPKVDGGWFNRGYNLEFTTSIQHHVTEGLGVQVGYYRRWFGNQTATDNLRVTPSDYSPFCVVTPIDPRLPGGGGQQMCGYYDLSPSKVGQVQNYVTKASNFGQQVQVYNGVEVSMSARMHSGLQVDGGFITERTRTAACYTVDSPQQVFCQDIPPFRTTVKFIAVYPLPWHFQVSGAYQGIPGPALNGRATFSRNQIVGLDHPLSTSTVTLTIVQPDSVFAGYTHKLDLRLSRIFRIGGFRRITTSLDIFNVTNSAGIQSLNTTVGPSWQYPTAIEPARLFRISGRYDF